MRFFLSLLFTITALVYAGGGFLMPSEAFKPSAALKNSSQIQIKILLGKNIYLYRDRLKISVVKPDGILLGDIKIPPGSKHEEDIVLYNSPTINVPLQRADKTVVADKVTVKVNFQGCSSQGLCYEPEEKLYTFNIDSSKIPLKKKPIIKVSESDKITQAFVEGNIGLVLLTFFGFGLLLALTPCVFPMIPILSSIIVSQGKNMNAKRGFLLSLVYVLSMSLAYTLAGVLAGLFGSNIQVAMQNPWVISTFALLFVGLAFSMFGFFEIGLPASWQSKLSKTSDKASSKGGMLGVAIMGFLSALIVGPCVAPPLAGALVYIGQTGDALLGGAALFVLSIGMGMPLLLIGTGAGKFMPNPGGWMENVSKAFGVIMLGIAIWMISRIVTEIITMYLVAILLIISSVYLGALEPLKKRSWDALFKGTGIIFLFYGLVVFYGALKGETNPFDPIPNHYAQNSSNSKALTAQKLQFKVVHSSSELDEVLKKSKGKKVMLDFYADWCVSCKELEHTTFKDPEVIEALKDFVLIQADVTQNTYEEKALSKRFGLFGPPGMIFFDENAQRMKSLDLIGYKDSNDFLKHIKEVVSSSDTPVFTK